MVKAVSRGQALEVAARVATQTKWEELDGDDLQKLINLSPEEFCKRLTAFLKAGAIMPAVEVQPPAPKRIRPPKGARIHTLRVRTKLDSEWQAAINAAGPNTPDHYNVRRVEDQYAPTGTGHVVEEFILLNYPNGDGSWGKALAWAKAKDLKNTDPRRVFAVGKEHPTLHTELGCDPMYVVATTECTFEGDHSACYVWWNGSKREANLNWVSNFGNSNDWFAFRNSLHFSPRPVRG